MELSLEDVTAKVLGSRKDEFTRLANAVVFNRSSAEEVLKSAGITVSGKASTDLMLQSARAGMLSALKFFKNTVGLDYKNRFQESALHFAARGGQVAVLKYLLAEGLNPTQPNGFGELPIFSAAEEGHLNAVRLLARVTPLDHVDKFGDTVLHFASRENRREIVEFLLGKMRRLMNIANPDNKTPMAYAFEAGHLELVKLFQAYGAKLAIVE